MYNKVFKNYQINVGNPFQVKAAVGFNTIKIVQPLKEEETKETDVDMEDLIAEAREEAEAIIKEAQYEAARIVDEAQSELEAMKISIEEEARKKGYEDGINESRMQYDSLLQEADQIRESAKAEYSEVISGIEADAVDLILDIAKTVVCREISTDKEYILHLVKEAFEKCTNKEKIVLRISSEDYDYVEENKGKLLSMVEGLGELELKRDCSLKEGSCVVETQYGSIDAGIQTKLEKIEEAFKQIIGR